MIRVPVVTSFRPPRSPNTQRQPSDRGQLALDRVWARIARIWWIVSGWVPLTPLGLLAIPLLVLTTRLFDGYQADMIVRSVCAGSVLLIAVDVLAVLVTAVWLAVRRNPPAAPLALEVGLPSRTGYRLGLTRWNPLVRVTVVWEDPPATARWIPARGGWEEEVVTVGRGEVARVRRCFTVSDLFGLSRLRVRRWATRLVVSRPAQGKPTSYEIRELFKAGDRLGRPSGAPDGDLLEMRRYLPGDPLKLVLWKVYARTGTMLVRSPEKAVDPTERTLAFLVAAEGDEPAAGLARLALEQELLGREVTFTADGAPAPARTTAEGVDQIVRSVRFRGSGGTDLDRFLVRGESVGVGACTLFVSHRPGPWLARVVATLVRHAGPFRAVVGVDGIERASDAPRRLGRLLFRRVAGDLPRVTDIRAVSAALSGAGAEVVLLDRQTGQRVTVDGV